MKKLLLFIFLTILSLNGFSQDTANVKKIKLNSIKVNLSSPLYGFTQFTYERHLFEKLNLEVGVGIIGLGDYYDVFHQKGLNFRGGVKFIFWHEKEKLLKGFYLKPELFFSGYNKDILKYGQVAHETTDHGEPYIYYVDEYYRIPHTFYNLAAVFNIGYQFLLWNIVTLDFNFGVGINYCFTPIEQAIDFFLDRGFIYGLYTNDETHFAPALSRSVKLGIAF